MKRLVRWCLLLLRYLWASPNTLIGLTLAALGVLAGGSRVRLLHGVLEVHGPGVRRLLVLLARAGFTIRAITLGHVVLGRDRRALERTRVHEAVHVRQYERWGPAFLPAYLLASFAAMVRGGDPYRHNRFERAAFAGEKSFRREV